MHFVSRMSNCVLGMFDAAQDVVRMVHQNVTRVGELNALGVSHKKLNTQFFFESAHLRGQGRLRHMDDLSRFGKTTQLGNRQEILDLFDVHENSVHDSEVLTACYQCINQTISKFATRLFWPKVCMRSPWALWFLWRSG